MNEKNFPYIVIGLVVVVLIVSSLNSIILVRKLSSPISSPLAGQTSPIIETKDIYSLGEVMVNLSGTNNYLKLGISLELKGKKEELDSIMKAKKIEMIDELIKVLSDQPVNELRTSEGKEKLKEKIKKSLSKIIDSEKIKKVYFTFFGLQLGG